MVPNLDPIALPAPVPVLQFLSALTFVLHVIPMNLVLGGGIIAAYAAWSGRRKNDANLTKLSGTVATVLPAATAASITLGVPPLLFLQVLYGPLFYTSSVLMAWPWLSVIGLLLVGYYGYYFFSLKRDKDGGMPVWAGVVASLAFIAISFIFSNNMMLMIQPEHFMPMWQEQAKGIMLHPGDSLFWPRYLHFLIGAVAVSGLLVMVIGLFAKKKDEAYCAWAVKQGGLVFVGATVIQFGVGIWQLLALKREVMLQFMAQGTSMAPTIYFIVGFMMALVALVLVLVAALGKAQGPMTVAGIVSIVVTIVFMTLMRAVIRTEYLGQTFVVEDQPVAPQWFVVVLFAVLLVAGLVIVGWMVHAVVTKKGFEGAAA